MIEPHVKKPPTVVKFTSQLRNVNFPASLYFKATHPNTVSAPADMFMSAKNAHTQTEQTATIGKPFEIQREKKRGA